MAKSRQSLRVRASQTTGGRRKKQTRHKKQTTFVERVFDEVKALVSDNGAAPKKTGTGGIRSGQQRQTSAKKAGAARIQSAQKRQAAAKKTVRTRRARTS